MIQPALHLSIFGWAVVAIFMASLWGIQLFTQNAAIVDFGWALSLVFLASFYAIRGDAGLWRGPLMAGMVGVWGLRLAFYLLFTRVIGQPEEGRYQELRAHWGARVQSRFFMFFQAQGLLNIVLAVPFLVVALNPRRALSHLEYAGAVLWVFAFLGEVLADAQLARFKANSVNRGTVCSIGLWRFSRHPNYFFEWLIWVSYALFALASPHGYLGLISPALILFFLLKVTGIPATEAQALRSKGEAYRRYQQTTSVFIPWIPKRSA
jgi:steroid 5-alpha reductase family enzyme